MRYTLSLFAILAFTACSQSATSVFENGKKDEQYGQNVQYTKVLKIINKNNIDAILNITYLNSTESSTWDNDKQNFLVGTYHDNNQSQDYNLTMNNKNAIKVKKLDKNDILKQNIAFKNHWASYNVYTFDEVQTSTLTLKYSNSTHQSSVVFNKE